MGSLIAGQEFQHILRLLNTNVDGKNKIMYALTSIRGIGRRFSNLVCKKAEVDLKKRAGAQLCCAGRCSRCLGGSWAWWTQQHRGPLTVPGGHAPHPRRMQASARLRSWSAS